MTQQHPFKTEPLDATFGAVVSGLTLTDLDDDAFQALYRTWLDYGLLIFPGQHLDRDQQIAFARRFGALEFDIAPISNVTPGGQLRSEPGDALVRALKGNQGWHCDSTYMPVQAKGAVFTAHVVPPAGGETGWADMRAAYDALDPAMRNRIAGLSAYHSINYSQARLDGERAEGDGYTGYGANVKDPPLRPLVKTHPETSRKTLMIGRHAFGIPGLTDGESENLLEALMDFACRPPRIHHHSWTPGDAVVWDNRSLMHRGCPWDMTQPRVMQHSRIAGDPVTEFAAHA